MNIRLKKSAISLSVALALSTSSVFAKETIIDEMVDDWQSLVQSIDESTVEERRQLERTMQEQLERLDQQIEEWDNQLDDESNSMNEARKDLLSDLKEKRDDLNDWLTKLGNTTENEWIDIKDELSDSYRSMMESVDEFMETDA